MFDDADDLAYKDLIAGSSSEEDEADDVDENRI